MKRIIIVAAVLLLLFAGLLPAAEHNTDKKTGDSGFVFIPMGFYTPETSLALGLSALYVLPQHTIAGDSSNSTPFNGRYSRTGNINTLLILTVRKQISVFTVGDWYSPDQQWNLNGGVFFRYFPDQFYGVGNDLPESGETGFTERSFRAYLLLRRKLYRSLHLGIRYEFVRNWALDPEAGGLLDDPLLAGREGGSLGFLSLEVDWDTRDNNFAPARGVWLQGGLARYAAWLGSGWTYTRGWLDMRGYLPLAAGHTLALQGAVQLSGGEQPWQGLQQLGGSKLLRGYYQGRYRDRQLLAVQTEYRFRIWNRWGAVVFAGLGQVADTPSQFAFDRFHWSAGAGVRFRIKDKINMRLDFGIGEEGPAVYILALEAF